MSLRKIAAIDVGSNAVRLLISGINEDNDGVSFKKILLVRIPLRLGEDSFSEEGQISDKKARKLIKLMKAYRNLMDVNEVESYKAYATAAMREAKNGEAIVEKIKAKAKIDLKIIDGSLEAKMIFESHIADKLSRAKNYLYVDVGGGSTEITVIANGDLGSSQSFNIGTIRMLRKKVTEAELEKMNKFLDQVKKKYRPVEIIGSGGNINKLHRLAKLNKEDILNINKLEEVYDQLKQLSVEERMKKFELNPDRADVIVPASEIFLHIASKTGINDIYVPTFGLVDGIVQGIYRNS